MEKGKLGFRRSLYAVLAFVFALLGQPFWALLVLGFAAVVERDEWATKQCTEALVLSILNIAVSVLYDIFSLVSSFFSRLVPSLFPVQSGDMLSFTDVMAGSQVQQPAGVLAMLFSVVSLVLSVCVFIFALRGLVRVVRGREAKTPVVWKVGAWAYNRLPKTDKIPPSVEDEEDV